VFTKSNIIFILAHSSRDTKAPLFQFKGDELCLHNISDLPDHLETVQFQPWKSVTLSNHDTCKIMSFITLKTGAATGFSPQDLPPIAQIMAIYTPLTTNGDPLPLALKTQFLIVDLYTKSSQSRAYKMPRYKYSNKTVIIHPEVSHID
jgi:hypothetical protein